MLPKEVREILEEMRGERIKGASYLAELGAKAFIELGKRGGSLEELCTEIVNVNPSMAPLQNLVLEVLKAGDPEEGARKFLEKIREAKKRLMELGSRKIMDGATVITHSYSSAVLSCVKKAWEEGKKFKVILSESQPDLEGLHFASKLKGEGIPFKVITDSEFILFSKDVSLGMCGADCITLGGYVFNKSGTSFLAFSCYYHGKPFYILAESYKIHPKSFSWRDIEIAKRPLFRELDNMKFSVENFLFDWTPPTLITSIITEKGEFRPEEILKALK